MRSVDVTTLKDLCKKVCVVFGVQENKYTQNNV